MIKGREAVIGLACVAMAMLVGACASNHPQSRRMTDLSGAELFQRLCASCHGPGGQGDGPVAPLIKSGVPDLTRIAFRDGGEFPAEEVRRAIDGRHDYRAHGPRDMPVWGWQFHDRSGADVAGQPARAQAMIGRLVDHVRSIQKE